MNKDVRQMVKRCKRAGFTVERGRGQHLIVAYQGRRVATMPISPSDWRWQKNLISDVRKATGIDLR